jgi:BON domain
MFGPGRTARDMKATKTFPRSKQESGHESLLLSLKTSPRNTSSTRFNDIHTKEMTAMYEEAQRFHEETDRDLERRVTQFLADRNLPGLRRLGVQSQFGVVTLRGRVRTFYEKQLSGQSARRVAGVVDVIDAIQVTDGVGVVPAPSAGAGFHEALASRDRGLDPVSQSQG